MGTLMHAHKINSWRADMSIQDVLNQVREGDRQNTKPWKFGEADHERTAWHRDSSHIDNFWCYLYKCC